MGKEETRQPDGIQLTVYEALQDVAEQVHEGACGWDDDFEKQKLIELIEGEVLMRAERKEVCYGLAHGFLLEMNPRRLEWSAGLRTDRESGERNSDEQDRQGKGRQGVSRGHSTSAG